MQRGFSLVETVVVTGILIAGVLTLVQVGTLALQAGDGARSRARLALLAQQKLEELRALPFASVAGALAGGELVEFLDGAGNAVCAGQPACPAAVFTRRTRPAPATPDSLLIEVTVERMGPAAQRVALVGARARRSR